MPDVPCTTALKLCNFELIVINSVLMTINSKLHNFNAALQGTSGIQIQIQMTCDTGDSWLRD